MPAPGVRLHVGAPARGVSYGSEWGLSGSCCSKWGSLTSSHRVGKACVPKTSYWGRTSTSGVSEGLSTGGCQQLEQDHGLQPLCRAGGICFFLSPSVHGEHVCILASKLQGGPAGMSL